MSDDIFAPEAEPVVLILPEEDGEQPFAPCQPGDAVPHHAWYRHLIIILISILHAGFSVRQRFF